jgi:large subunit ribosomal protein L23
MVILEKVKTSEKVVRLIEAENTLCFEVDRNVKKENVKKEVEELFDVKVEKVRTHNRKNKKLAYVKLNSEFLASDVATKLGLL